MDSLFDSTARVQPHVAVTPDGPAGWHPPGLPSRHQLGYCKELMVVVLLSLAFPWVLWKLLTEPRKVISGVKVP